jgi:hypothetical protein
VFCLYEQHKFSVLQHLSLCYCAVMVDILVAIFLKVVSKLKLFSDTLTESFKHFFCTPALPLLSSRYICYCGMHPSGKTWLAHLSWAQEHQAGRGIAREERFSGSQRRIVNQHRTGVACHLALRDILQRRSEHLWTEEFNVQCGLSVD